MSKEGINKEASLVADLKSSGSRRERAFRVLISEHRERLYWHIRKMVFSHDDADDILQNTFVKVYRNIDGFKAESRLYTWLYRIATNEAITFLNQKASRNHTSVDEVVQQAAEGLGADPYFDGDEAQLKLQKAVAALPQKQQLVFNMKYFDDMMYEDISRVTGTSVGALKASYHIAVKKITEFLSENH